jgi:hypothetical protein
MPVLNYAKAKRWLIKSALVALTTEEKNFESVREQLHFIFLFWEFRGFSPNFHIHVSVIDLYIPQDRSTYFSVAE